jgi:hypothetical protein
MGREPRFLSRKAHVFPRHGTVAWLTASQPITVAGPRPICTAFPASIACKFKIRVYVGHLGVSTNGAVRRQRCPLGNSGQAGATGSTTRHATRAPGRWALASAIFPVGLALFDERAQPFLGILEAIKLIEKNIHGLLEAVA